MAPSEKCEAHQKVFFSVCAFFVTVIIFLVGYMVTNDRRALAAEKVLSTEINTAVTDEKNDLREAQLQAAKEHAEMLASFSETNQQILKRLTRIETQLEMIMKMKPRDMTWIWQDVSNIRGDD